MQNCFFLGRLIHSEGCRVCPGTLTAIFTTEYTAVLRVSGVVSIFNCRQSVRVSKELFDPNESGCASA